MKHPRLPARACQAFTLVELSIVLVIIGLLVGAVTVGDSLIQAARLNSVITGYQRFTAASQNFETKYFALPGDMPNATSYWGVAGGDGTGNDAACSTSLGVGTATCNGNGDGHVINNGNVEEAYRVWQHLANAGLIEGSFTGVDTPANTLASTTLNSPTSKIRGSMWFAWDWSGNTNTGLWNVDYTNFIFLGKYTAGGWPYSGLLSGADLWNIDKKIDDGKPGTGIMITYAYYNCTYGTSWNDFNADYNVTNNNSLCDALFPRAF